MTSSSLMLSFRRVGGGGGRRAFSLNHTRALALRVRGSRFHAPHAFQFLEDLHEEHATTVSLPEPLAGVFNRPGLVRLERLERAADISADRRREKPRRVDRQTGVHEIPATLPTGAFHASISPSPRLSASP